jgi:hypothetical protein
MEDLLAVFFPLIEPKKIKVITFVLGDDDNEEEDVVTFPPIYTWD